MSDYPCGCSKLTEEELRRRDPGQMMPELSWIACPVYSGKGFIDGKLADYIYCEKHRNYWGVKKYKCLDDKPKRDFNSWLKTHGCDKETLWYLQNCLGTLYGYDSKNAKQAAQAWKNTADTDNKNRWPRTYTEAEQCHHHHIVNGRCVRGCWDKPTLPTLDLSEECLGEDVGATSELKASQEKPWKWIEARIKSELEKHHRIDGPQIAAIKIWSEFKRRLEL